MRKLMIAALLAGQAGIAAQPARAADMTDARNSQMGAFGGLRLRVPLDGPRREQRLRAGLTVAPTLHTNNLRGESRLRIGEGVELGFTGGEPVALSIGGRDARRMRLGATQGEDAEDGGGIPTWALITGGVVVALGIGWLVFEDAMNDASE